MFDRLDKIAIAEELYTGWFIHVACSGYNFHIFRSSLSKMEHLTYKKGICFKGVCWKESKNTD